MDAPNVRERKELRAHKRKNIETQNTDFMTFD